MLIAALKEYSSEEEDSEDDEDLRESLFMLVRGPVTRVRQFISTRGSDDGSTYLQNSVLMCNVIFIHGTTYHFRRYVVIALSLCH